MSEFVTSADGTTIAYETVGDGPAVILIGGALNTRESARNMAGMLANRFTVYIWDRRGRGDSGDTLPWSPQREVEDLAALVMATGEDPAVYGHSSGAILALEAAAAGVPIRKIVGYEPPYTFDAAHPVAPDVTVQRALDAGDRDGAVAAFMHLVGMPDERIDGMKQTPFWPSLTTLAHTLVYDLGLAGDSIVPTQRFATIAAPTLMIDGGDSPPWAVRASLAVTTAVPGATHMTLAGQTHDVDEAELVPTVAGFFS